MPDHEFFICRPPGLAIRGYLGTFQPTNLPVQFGTKTGVYVQPWDKNSPLQTLQITQNSTKSEELAFWCDAELPNINQTTFCISQEGFTLYVQKVLQAIVQGKIQKVVTARKKIIERNGKPNFEIFKEICQAYPNAFVYILQHSYYGMWLGASPEIFLNGNGKNFETVALAGTLVHEKSKWTEKEISEQGITADFIEKKLLELNVGNLKKQTTETTTSGPLKHLFSQFLFTSQVKRARLLLQEMHPTPAVGGYPQLAAVDFIAANENLDRAIYAGWLGFSENGNFQSRVNLRCAKLFNTHAELYAGCGINAGSNPALEWIETEAKMDVIGKFIEKKN